ncbi:MAG: SAM-dependent methyltransferase [Proteobacteria bacterium]|nr:SAM-dependent methyltransferase [Pseudomonadota bacterium]
MRRGRGGGGTSPLRARLVRRIRRFGPLSVAEYMAVALHDPEQGYYATRDPLGAAGDFVTAPEVSQMFGELIGLWSAVVWQAMGSPDPVLLVELGPGRGTLMADALRAAARAPGFRAAIRVHLVEASARLKAAQATTLAGAGPRWHASLAEVPEGPSILIANEFFDALPLRQFERAEAGWHERLVGLDARARLGFVREARPFPGLPPGLADDRPPGAVVEVSAAALALAAAIAGRTARVGGAALILDYGAEPPAPGGTLQAVRRHRPVDVLDAPGEADITAHVDFAALARTAEAAGARAFGPLAQGTWLRRLGIETRAEALRGAASGAEQRAAIDSALRRLIAPEEMGTLFKALAVAHPGLGIPPGFEEDA